MDIKEGDIYREREIKRNICKRWTVSDIHVF